MNSRLRSQERTAHMGVAGGRCLCARIFTFSIKILYCVCLLWALRVCVYVCVSVRVSSALITVKVKKITTNNEPLWWGLKG